MIDILVHILRRGKHEDVNCEGRSREGWKKRERVSGVFCGLQISPFKVFSISKTLSLKAFSLNPFGLNPGAYVARD